MNLCTNLDRVAIILLGAMGDCIRLLTCFKHARHIPRVTWFISHKWSDLSKLDPRINFIFLKPNIGSVLSILKSSRHYDIVLDMQRIFKSGVLSFILGRARVGFHPADCKEFNHLFNNVYIPRWRQAESKLEKYVGFLTLLGIEVVIPKMSMLRASREVALVLGGSWNSKKLSPSDLKMVVETFREAGFDRFWLIGGDDCKSAAQVLEKYMKKSGFHFTNMVGCSLSETIEFCRHFNGVGFGSDTGMAHMFAYFQKPYITVFGPSDPIKNTPLGMSSLAIKPTLVCAPCEKRSCFFGTNFCLTSALTQLNETLSEIELI